MEGSADQKDQLAPVPVVEVIAADLKQPDSSIRALTPDEAATGQGVVSTETRIQKTEPGHRPEGPLKGYYHLDLDYKSILSLIIDLEERADLQVAIDDFLVSSFPDPDKLVKHEDDWFSSVRRKGFDQYFQALADFGEDADMAGFLKDIESSFKKETTPMKSDFQALRDFFYPNQMIYEPSERQTGLKGLVQQAGEIAMGLPVVKQIVEKVAPKKQ